MRAIESNTSRQWDDSRVEFLGVFRVALALYYGDGSLLVVGRERRAQRPRFLRNLLASHTGLLGRCGLLLGRLVEAFRRAQQERGECLRLLARS